MQGDPISLAPVVAGLVVLLGLVSAVTIHYWRRAIQLEKELGGVTRLTEKMLGIEQELRFIVQFLREIPHLVGTLNTPKQRDIPECLMDVLVRLFAPEQAVVLIRRRATLTRPDRDRQLIVAAVHSPSVAIKTGMRIDIGEGELGRLAEARYVLARVDFDAMEDSSRPDEEPGLKGLRVDLGCRMAIGNEALGVLAITKPEKETSHRKEVLRLISQLGAFALSHATEREIIQSMADLDPLTSVYNKGIMVFRLGELLYHAEKEHQKVAIFFFGIDHFKNYNDHNGHIAGDDLLKMLVRVCRDQLRSEDIFCRFGGDLFCLLLPDRSAAEAYITAEKIRLAVEDFDFRHGHGQPMGRLTISGGVAGYPACASSSTELLQAADTAYYQAKNSGRNRVVVAPSQEIDGRLR